MRLLVILGIKVFDDNLARDGRKYASGVVTICIVAGEESGNGFSLQGVGANLRNS